MLRKILSISGKPSLYKLISYTKSMLIVEDLKDGKRMPAYARDKIISLGDISMYTEEDEVALAEVFDSVKKIHSAKALDESAYKDGAALSEFFAEVLPSYDRDRVHTSDIKKVIKWYNLLINAGITDFVTKDEEKEEKSSEEPAEK